MTLRAFLVASVIAIIRLGLPESVRADEPLAKAPPDAPPATQPATQPSTQSAPAVVTAPADATTPKGAMLIFIRALEAGDGEGTIAATVIRDDADRDMLIAVASATKAHADLRRAFKEKWGDTAPGPEVQVKGLTRVFSEFDFTDPVITETGETAKAVLHYGRGTIFLAKQPDAWRISLEACMKDYSNYKASDVISTFKEAEDMATKLIERVKAGEFESYESMTTVLETAERQERDNAQKRKAAGL